MTKNIATDYLIVGSGAVGMAFADTLLTETDATLTIVDRHPAPGGHWNDAYPFVTLHQHSAFYGVSSKELSKGHVDQVGLNKGLGDLATGAEINAYFDEVMRQTFLPSGRVQYFPLTDYEGEGRITSLLSGETRTIDHKKRVDTTFLKTGVPSTHTPSFTVDEGVKFIPINDLVRTKQPPKGFVVIGGGKTGIDACLWLLHHGVNPDQITWIRPRDAWMIDRKNTQPTMAFFENTIGSQASLMESLALADDRDDAFDRLEASGYFLRLDPEVRPRMFHAATISQAEIEALRQIRNVVRLGRVKRISSDLIELDEGSIATSLETVHVDCSASAITNMETTPIFDGPVITPQMVRSYQPIFSAALVAHVEATYQGDAQKNALCGVVPVPNSDQDFFRFTAASMMNQYTWGRDKALRAWLLEDRLDGFSKLVASVPAEDTARQAIIKRIRDNAMPAMNTLQRFIATLDEAEAKQEPAPVSELQVNKADHTQTRLQSVELQPLEAGDVRMKVEQFGFSANNITYAVMGHQIRYWSFFPPQSDAVGEQGDEWGLVPVWGFATAVESRCDDLAVGSRLFGYWPTASHLTIRPTHINKSRVVDGMPHRRDLPRPYNAYRRMDTPNPMLDQPMMLLSPLYLTSWCLWDYMVENQWFGAGRVLILSASSKTSIGLATALTMDPESKPATGLTSAGNAEFVAGLGLYDAVVSYDSIEALDPLEPTVIVDMSGNALLLQQIQAHLGEALQYCIRVGLTHWDEPTRGSDIPKDRQEMFFAPSHFQKRTQDWGAKELDQRTTAFMMQAGMKAQGWLSYQPHRGLSGLQAVYDDVAQGKVAPDKGLIIKI